MNKILIISIIIVSLIFWFILQSSKEPAEFVPEGEMYLTARSSPLDTTLADLIECESGGDEQAIGDEGRAYGILQFHEPTFTEFAQKYNIKRDWKDPTSQIILAREMIADGYGYLWTCHKLTPQRD